MSRKVKVLEQRVTKAVGRLRELSSESRRLERELDDARQRLEESRSAVDPERIAAAETWDDRRQEAVALVEETLAELRTMESLRDVEGG